MWLHYICNVVGFVIHLKFKEPVSVSTKIFVPCKLKETFSCCSGERQAEITISDLPTWRNFPWDGPRNLLGAWQTFAWAGENSQLPIAMWEWRQAEGSSVFTAVMWFLRQCGVKQALTCWGDSSGFIHPHTQPCSSVLSSRGTGSYTTRRRWREFFLVIYAAHLHRG